MCLLQTTKLNIMKNKLIIILTLMLLTITCFGQQDFEKKTYIEINERADFYEVNGRYQILNDNIFYCTSGFLIDAEFDTLTKDGIEYVIVTYPKYINDAQSDKSADTKIDTELKIEDIVNFGLRQPIKNFNEKILMIEKVKFDKLSKTTLYDTKWTLGKIGSSKKWYGNLGYIGYVIPYPRNYKITTGLLTIPFKLRPSQDSLNFKMTTDVTIGPYFGITKRMSKRSNNYFTIPATLGLSFINITSNTTTTQNNNNDVDVIPGFSWSTGLILQFNKFSIGYVLGQDYASGLGKNWAYHGELWHSFAIGYSFLKEDN